MVTNNQIMDERSAQNQFYENMFGPNWQSIITVDRSTDGYSDYVLFEHKKNISVTGIGKCLGQALIYLAKFNRDGVPVPNTIMLVSQDENKVYVFKTEHYADIVNNNMYAQHTASGSLDITVLGSREPEVVINYGYSAVESKEFLAYFENCKDYFKPIITECNVVGWSEYYYDNAETYKLKPKKTEFFNQLRHPTSFMAKVIEPWTGVEEDFSAIMDLLNDPAGQKKLGAFYTPEAYCKKAAEMLEQQIEEYKVKYPGDDYLIIDRCAGSGNLENVLSDDLLSHCILSTYELKEWIALKNRIGHQVRLLIPHLLPDGEEPDHTSDGLLEEADAFTESFCNNLKRYIKECRKTEHCGIFFFENPPYGEPQALQTKEANGKSKERAKFLDQYLCVKFKEAHKDTNTTDVASRDMANLFIWSAFEMFMENEDDGYVVFSPLKYWKSQNVISKTFVNGFIADKKYFHASSSAVSVISWKNKDSNIETFRMNAYDIINGKTVYADTVQCKKIHKKFCTEYYGENYSSEDSTDGIWTSTDGREAREDLKRNGTPRYNDNMIGCLIAIGCDTNKKNVGTNSGLISTLRYDGNGLYLRKDSFLEKLPMFVAGEFPGQNDKWYYVDLLNRTGDGSERFKADIESGSIKNWLIKCMLWSCWTSRNHMYSFVGSDGRQYTNNLALSQNSIADKILEDNQYSLDPTEADLMARWNNILDEVRKTSEYNREYRYGLYQIEEEINIRIGTGTYDRSGKEIFAPKYADLDNQISIFKKRLKDYYLKELVDNLFKYEFIK